jgi:hypothetical protein
MPSQPRAAKGTESCRNVQKLSALNVLGFGWYGIRFGCCSHIEPTYTRTRRLFLGRVFLQLTADLLRKEELDERLVRDVALVREAFELLKHGLRKPQ